LTERANEAERLFQTAHPTVYIRQEQEGSAMKHIHPDDIKMNQEASNDFEMACSAEFSQGCIESDEAN